MFERTKLVVQFRSRSESAAEGDEHDDDREDDDDDRRRTTATTNDEDDDDMAAALGGKRRLQQVLSVFFPTLASTRPGSVSRSIATALDDASTPQQAAAYVASLPGQQFAAPYALCASVLAGTSLRRGEALTTMRAPDDQGEAALLAVVSAGVAKASAEAGEAVALARQSLRQLEAYTTMTRSTGNWEITMEKNPMPKPPSADASSSGGGAAGAS